MRRSLRSPLGLESVRAIATLFDQAWLSAVNFGVGLLLIRLADKTDYAIYVQLFAALLLTVSVRNSIVDSPLLTLAPRQQGDEARQTFVRGALSLQNRLLGLVLLVALILMIITPLVAPSFRFSTSLIAAVLAWTAGHWMREFVRIVGFVRLQPEQALYVDVAFGLLTIAGVALCLGGGLSVTEMVAALAAGNLIAAAWMVNKLRLYQAPPRPWRQALADVWPLARFAIPGTVITWLFTYTFPYIATATVSTVAAANLAATKLLIMPVGIVAVALTNLLQPRMAGWIEAGQLATVARTATWVALGGTGLVTAYLFLLLLVYGHVETWVLGEDYMGLANITTLWGIYAWLGLLRATGLAVVLAGKQYRRMLTYNIAALAAYVPAVIVAGNWMGQAGIVLGVVIAESIIALLIWTNGVRSVLRSVPA